MSNAYNNHTPVAIVGICVVIFFSCRGTGTVHAQSKPPADPTSLPSLDIIQQAFRTRERQMRSARFAWVTQRTDPKGSRKSPSMNKAINPEGETVPAEDTTFTIEASFAVDGNRMRYEYQHANWDYGSDYEGPKSAIDVFDGKTGKDYRPPGAVLGFPAGHITNQWRNDTNAQLFPFLWTIRPTATVPMKGVIIKRTGELNGHKCVILEQPRPKVEFWLDPAWAYAVVRRVSFAPDGAIGSQFDVKYASHHAPEVWIPQSWTATFLRAGSPQMLFSGELKSFQSPTELTLADVDIDFPVGTRVVDETRKDGDPSRKGLVEYIVRDSGQKRPITRDEWAGIKRGDKESGRAAYERIVDTEPGASYGTRARWWVTIGGVAVVLVIALVVWRVRKSRL